MENSCDDIFYETFYNIDHNSKNSFFSLFLPFFLFVVIQLSGMQENQKFDALLDGEKEEAADELKQRFKTCQKKMESFDRWRATGFTASLAFVLLYKLFSTAAEL